MSTSFERITTRRGDADVNGAALHSTRAQPLHGCAATRALEHHYRNASPALMRRAGLATAQLALALAPHARTFWIACGPGNNAGDGLLAAGFLQAWGKRPIVTATPPDGGYSGETLQAWNAARAAGVLCQSTVPEHFDFCIDALFGIGTLRAFQSPHSDWIRQMNNADAPVLAIDLPSGLDADTGTCQPVHVCADHTLSLLTLKPGLFTAHGRDVCGEVWLHRLNCADTEGADAQLMGAPLPRLRGHDSHKGSYGDVAIVGGAPGMTGAALLAGSAALHAGAGRVYLSLPEPPESGYVMDSGLMLRPISGLPLNQIVVVAGCGAGTCLAPHLSELITRALVLVLDADALNQIAGNSVWQRALAERMPGRTVMTPHPLEAARLLGCNTAQIQSDRLASARQLAARFQCAVVLKGSGTVVCAPGQPLALNPTGNAELARAGSGDVLAGLIGARLANQLGLHGENGLDTYEAACAAVYQHGYTADQWHGSTLTAQTLAQSLTSR